MLKALNGIVSIYECRGVIFDTRLKLFVRFICLSWDFVASRATNQLSHPLNDANADKMRQIFRCPADFRPRYLAKRSTTLLAIQPRKTVSQEFQHPLETCNRTILLSSYETNERFPEDIPRIKIKIWTRYPIVVFFLKIVRSSSSEESVVILNREAML